MSFFLLMKSFFNSLGIGNVNAIEFGSGKVFWEEINLLMTVEGDSFILCCGGTNEF